MFMKLSSPSQSRRFSPSNQHNKGKVYVGSLDTRLYCLDVEIGSIVWSFETDGVITSSPAVVDGVAYVISQEPSSGGLYRARSNGTPKPPIRYSSRCDERILY